MKRKVCILVIILMLALTGCELSQSLDKVIKNGQVEIDFEVNYVLDDTWAKENMEQYDDNSAFATEWQKSLGYNKLQLKAKLDYTKKVGKIEIDIPNSINDKLSRRGTIYIQDTKIYVPTWMLYNESLKETMNLAESKRMEQVIGNKPYILCDLKDGDGENEFLNEMMYSGMSYNMVTDMLRNIKNYSELIWSNNLYDLKQFEAFYKGLDTRIKKEGNKYTLEMNLNQSIDLLERGVDYTLEQLKEEHFPQVQKYTGCTKEEFEQFLEFKESTRGGYKDLFTQLRQVALYTPIGELLNKSSIKAIWDFSKGVDQNTKIQVIIPKSFMEEYVDEEKATERNLTIESKCSIRNINNVSIVLPKDYIGVDKVDNVYTQIREEQRKIEEEYQERQRLASMTRVLSYVWSEKGYAFDVMEMSAYFGKTISGTTQSVNGRLFVSEEQLKADGYNIELEYNGDKDGGYAGDPINYFTISKGTQKYRFTGRPIVHISIDKDYKVTREACDTNGLGWMIIYNGEEVLHRGADNELSYTYFMQEPGEYEVYVVKWITEGYEPISNVIRYTIKE